MLHPSRRLCLARPVPGNFQQRWRVVHPFCFVGQLALVLEEDPVAHFVILPNYEEDETVLRETLESRGCSLSAEKHMRMVLAMDRLVAATGHLLRGCDGQLSYA